MAKEAGIDRIRWIDPDDAACRSLTVLRDPEGTQRIAAVLQDDPSPDKLDAALERGFHDTVLPDTGDRVLLWPEASIQLGDVRAVFPDADAAHLSRTDVLWQVSRLPELQRDNADASDDPPNIGERVNRFQNRYVPRSQAAPGVAMVPANMSEAIQNALARTETRHGDLDRFVADRLGRDARELGQILGAEQVDAVSLAIDANEAGRAFVLADQTGLGKGRILAALSAAAARRGQTVIFITEKSNLFTDFWRDVRDIGADADFTRPFIPNTGARILDADTGRELFTSGKKKDIDPFITERRLPEGCNLVMMTYSQVQQARSAKADWLREIAANAFVVADESHNAVGSSNTARIISEATALADGAVYSSATFAARPESMAAYAPVFPQGFMSSEQLKNTVKNGGKPLQEALSQTLADDGVLVRREHDLSDVEVEVKDDTDRVPRNQDYVDRLAPILRTMAEMSLRIQEIVDERNEANKARVDKLPKKKQKAARESWNTAAFGTRLAAIVRQFVSALKVDAVVDECVESLRQGQKPVVVLEATMQSLMEEIAGGELGKRGTSGHADLFAGDGESGDADDSTHPPGFRDALRLMLDRMMTLSVRYGTGDREEYPVDDPDLVAQADALKREIDAFPDLSMNLIDDVRERVEAAGYRADEISARSVRVNNGVYENRPDVDRNEIIAGFNNGDIDALVLTSAGATGLSLHASSRVSDQRPRRLIELQIPSNVVERVQFWGRVNRKGQVVSPSFCTLSTGLPFEMRSLAQQNKKAEALSANVSASSESSAAMDVPDLLDETGNEVCKRLMEESPWIAENMGISLNVDPTRAQQELYHVNKLMQRLVLLPSEQQDKVYQSVVAAYEDALRELEARTGARGRVRELDGYWTRKHVEVFDNGPDLETSVFGEPIYLTTLSSMRDRAPLRGDDVRQRIAEANKRMADTDEGKPLTALAATVRRNERRLLERRLPRRVTDVDAALNQTNDNAVKRNLKRYRLMCDILENIEPGWRIYVPDPDTGTAPEGVVLDIRWPETRKAHLPGSYMLRYALPGDETAREVSLAAVIRGTDTDEPIRIDHPDLDRVCRAFDEPQGGRVEVNRKVLEGNLFAAVDLGQRYSFGHAAVYFDEAGQQRRGLLLPRNNENVLDRVPGIVDSAQLAGAILQKELGSVFTNPEKPQRGLSLKAYKGSVYLRCPAEENVAKKVFPSSLEKVCQDTWKKGYSKVGKARLRDIPQIYQTMTEAGYRFHFEGEHRHEVTRLARKIAAAQPSNATAGRSAASAGTMTRDDKETEPALTGMRV